MKTLKIFLFVAILFCFSFTLFACGETPDENTSTQGLEFRLNEDGKSYEVVNYSGTDSSVIIPDKYKDQPVTKIGSYAFSECDTIISVTIPNSVTDISEHAFSLCNNLMSITIGSGVKNISNFAFSCKKLVEVINHSSLTIPIGNTEFGDGTSSLGYFALEIHSGESKLVNKDGYYFYTVNGTNYLINCIQNDKDITLPSDFNGKNYLINKNAFIQNKNITRVTIPENVTSIGDSAFRSCDSLTNVTIGNSVTSIGDSAFEFCDSLTNVTIGNSVTSIGDSAFRSCDNIMSITIPSSVTSIGVNAFIDCNKLIEIINKTQLQLNGGYYGNYLLEIHSGDSKIITKDGYLFYTVDGINYLVGYVGNDTDLSLPDKYNGENYKIHEKAFSYNTKITSIVIPNTLSTSIYDDMFSNCTNLKSVTIPDCINYIGSSAFYNCSKLTDIYIGNGVTRIYEQVFEGCNNLENIYITDLANWCNIRFATPILGDRNLYLNGTLVTDLVIPDNVTNVSKYAFSTYKKLTSVTFGSNVSSISDFAFANCSELMSINIGENVTNIDYYAFHECYKLVEIVNNSSLNISKEDSNHGDTAYYTLEIHTGESKLVNKDGYYFYSTNDKNYLVNYLGTATDVALPSNFNGETYSINEYAFYGNEDITSLNISDSVIDIGRYAFWGCSNLAGVDIGNNLKNISEAVFRDCSKLTRINIPDSVITIGSSAFSGCSKLTHITIPDSVITIGGSAFSGCSELTTVSLGSNITDIPNTLFSGCEKLTSITIGKSVTHIGIGAFNGCANLTSIKYKGSEDEWNAISKGTNWDAYTGNYTVTYNYDGE